MAYRPYVTIVSGLPRSGTSLMMQLLHAGGIPAVTDKVRAADDDNPRGYFEFEQVKQIRSDKSWLPEARGKVVKMVHLLLLELPDEFEYRVVFMRRRLEEVLKSQSVMLERHGKKGAALSPSALMKVYQDQINKVLGWMAQRPNFRVLEVNYNELVQDPLPWVRLLAEFLEGPERPMDEQAMTGAVDPALYRNRS